MSEPAPGAPAGGVPTCYRHPEREAYIRCQRCEKVICPDCMRDSAVGFQCPDCVKEGAKTTRSGRTAYGGLRPTDASITSLAIIALNVGVWLALVLAGGHDSRLFRILALRPNGLCSLGSQGGFEVGADVCRANDGTVWPGVADGAYWQLLTSAFSHVEIWHIAVNMLIVYVLGPQLELSIGRARYVALYLLSALAGSTLVYWASSEYGATLGASGATFGLMGALLVINYKKKTDVQQILLWVVISVVFSFTRSDISWQGHVGGLLGGMAVAAILAYAPRGRRTQVQVAGMAVIGILLAVAIVARTASLTG